MLIKNANTFSASRWRFWDGRNIAVSLVMGKFWRLIIKLHPNSCHSVSKFKTSWIILKMFLYYLRLLMGLNLIQTSWGGGNGHCALLCPRGVTEPLWFNVLNNASFLTVSGIKIIATHFAKGVVIVEMALRYDINFRPTFVKFTSTFCSSGSVLLQFLPVMLSNVVEVH